MKDLRRLVSTVVIVSFSLAALMGIAALLGGGDFGETQTRVLITTIIVGFESIAALCYLSVAGHRLAVVGAAGGLVSLVAFVLALWLTWANTTFDDDGLLRTFGVALTIAVSLAQASLLLALAGRRSLRPGLVGTLAAIGLMAVMIVIPILDDQGLGDGYWRIFGVVAILDVLGTVIVTALAAFRRRHDDGDRPGDLLSEAVKARLMAEAHGRGTSPSQLVSDALDAYLTPR
jgi:hypothetical protein